MGVLFTVRWSQPFWACHLTFLLLCSFEKGNATGVSMGRDQSGSTMVKGSAMCDTRPTHKERRGIRGSVDFMRHGSNPRFDGLVSLAG